MSEQIYPDFTFWGAIKASFQVIRDDFSFFGIMMLIMVVVSVLPSMFMNSYDFTDTEILAEQLSGGGQAYFYLILFASLLFYTFYIIFIIDKTYAHLNNISFE